MHQRCSKLEHELDAARSQVSWLSRQLFGQKAERVDPSQVEREWLKFNAGLETKAKGPVPAAAEVTTSLQLVLHMIGDAPGDVSQRHIANETGSGPVDAETEPGTEIATDAPATQLGTSSHGGQDEPRRRKGHGRRKLPETLSTRYIVLEPEDVPEGARRIGDKVSERLGIVPRHLERIVIVRPVYAVTQDVEGWSRPRPSRRRLRRR